MDIQNRLKNALAAFRKQNNTVGPDPNHFLRYGNRKMMPSTWSTPDISDQDFYTGYGFAVINKRANRSVVLGKKFLYTDAKEEIVKKANETGARVTHPYLELIRNSIDFAERDFWYDISTYLDLEGVYYLMAVRTIAGSGRVGNIQKFSLLNPYNVRPVVDANGNLGGYVERHKDKQREIPVEMMIPITLLNPFDNDKTYSLADAARDSQFTMKQANDFAREAIDGNLNAPGILSSAIELPDDQFDNFVERVKHHGRGEPLFGNGAGTISWMDMQTDLDKAALDKINSINRDTLLAISGLSKTGVGVEESGTGREVSRTQKDDFTENAVMPQIENIIDALNLDYRRYYAEDYKRYGFVIALDNPLETDRDAEAKDVEIRDSQFALLQSLLDAGYDYEIASKYAKGLIDITDLGPAPEEDVEEDQIDETPMGDGQDPNEPDNNASEDDPVDPEIDNSLFKGEEFTEDIDLQIYEGYPVPLTQYLLNGLAEQITSLSERGSTLYLTQETDKVRITHLEERDGKLIGVIDQNSYAELADFNEGADKEAILEALNKRYHHQLIAIKQKKELDTKSILDEITQSVIVEPITHVHNNFDKQAQIDIGTNNLMGSIQAAENQLLSWYLNEISQGELAPGANIEAYANNLALPFSVWFTVMFPILASARAVETAADLGIKDVPITAMTADIKDMISDFAAREANSHMETIKGDIENALTIIRTYTSNPEEIKQLLQEAFISIQQRRAALIASNASSRIFALSQYEADLQLLARNNLLDKAYKQLYSGTGNPCSFCASLIATTGSEPVSFTKAFASLGDSLTVDGKTMDFNYESIMAGNVHPNCHCYYKIVIEDHSKNDAAIEQEEIDKHVQAISDGIKSEIAPLIDKLYSDKNTSEEIMNKLADASTRLDEKIVAVENKLEQLDKRTKEAKQIKEDLLEANELKSKLSEAEEYAKQLERIIDGQI